jgi:hypothetical protein
MKNYFLKFSLIALFFVTLTGCEEDVVIWDGVNGDAVSSFQSSIVDFPVSDVGESFVDVVVDVNTVSDADRAIAVDVQASSTATANQYTINQATLIIPAGSYNGVIKIKAGAFEDIPEGASVKLNLLLSSVEGSGVAELKSKVTLNIFRGCAFPAIFGVGNYLIEEITAFVPGSGPTFENGTVRPVIVDPNNKFNRIFTSYSFPNFCTTTRLNFTFGLICGKVVIPAGNRSNCTCGPTPYVYGPPIVNGTYDPTDDSVIFVTFTNDVTGNCGAAVQTTYRLTKQ